MSITRKVHEWRAKKAFEDFTGHKPTKINRSELDGVDVTGFSLGRVVGIAYEAKRDGETAQYFHRFNKKSRPNLVARDDGKKLYIDGGKYKVTDRGIEDMPHLFVVNPSPRSGKKKRRVSIRTGGTGTMRRTRTRRRRVARRAVTVYNVNPRRRRRRVASFLPNPIRRRRRRSVASYRRNPSRRRGFRRNPSARGLASMAFPKLIMPALGIGIGAVGSEIVMGYLPLPAQMKTGAMRHVTKAGVSLAGGYAIAKFLGQKKLGEMFALGGLVIAAHDVTKELILQFSPGVKFGSAYRGSDGYGQYLPTGGMGYYVAGQTMRRVGSGMGAYMPLSAITPQFAGGSGDADYSGT